MPKGKKVKYSDKVRAYREKNELFSLHDVVAGLQMELDNLPAKHPKGEWHRRELLKDISKVLQAIQSEGKADSVEIHNHVYPPGSKPKE